jgi:hypothetical protein
LAPFHVFGEVRTFEAGHTSGVGSLGLTELAIASLGLTELFIVLVVVVVVFGAIRLPGIDGSRGSSSITARWSRADWILVIAAVASTGVALALSALQH